MRSRREFLRLGLTGLAGLSLPQLYRLRAGGGGGQRRSQAAGDDRRVPARRGQPPGDLGPQARRPARVSRAVPDHRHQHAGPAALRAAAAGRPRLPTGSPSSGRWCIRASATASASSRCSPGHEVREFKPRLGASGIPRRSPTACAAQPGRQLPNYVGAPPIPYLGSAYLGPACRAVRRQRRSQRAGVPRAQHRRDATRQRWTAFDARRGLREQLDGLRRAARRPRQHAGRRRSSRRWRGTCSTRPAARAAFDLSQEDAARPRPLRPQHLGPAVPAGPAAGRGGRRLVTDDAGRPALRPRAELGRPRRQPSRLRRA